jgi:hypothetical protein
VNPAGGDFVVVDFAACDSSCANSDGYAYIAAFGTGRAREIAVAHRNATLTPTVPKAGGGSKRNPLWVGDVAWDAAQARALDKTVEQFCYAVTETKIRRFEPLFQNDRFLVLKVKSKY